MVRESLQTTVERLSQSSGGQILASVREGLQRSLKFYVALFLLGFMVAFPLSSAVSYTHLTLPTKRIV